MRDHIKSIDVHQDVKKFLLYLVRKRVISIGLKGIIQKVCCRLLVNN